MKAIGIRAKLGLIFVAFAAVLVGIGVFALLRLDAESGELRRRMTAAEAIATGTGALQLEMTAMSDAMRGFLLDPSDTAESAKKEEADRKFTAQASDLRALVADFPQFLKALDQIADFDEKSLNPLEDQVLKLTKTDKAAAVAFYKEKYYPVRLQEWNMMVDLNKTANAFQASQVEEINALANSERFYMLVGSIGILAVAGFLAWIIGSGFSRPILALAASMERLARRDMLVDVPFAKRRDEIGTIARSVCIFRDSMIGSEKLEAETKLGQAAAADERKREMRQLADQFERAIGGIVNMVSSAATKMQMTASQLTTSAQETSEQSSAVSSAAEEASANVFAVASSAEELVASGREIGRQVERSAQMSNAAVAEAEGTAAIVSELTAFAASIGGVVDTITNLAGQTNLLALNATIEAARAGEAGRGFAVVAAEVKELANQTAKATTEITSKIEAIQSSTSRAASAIGGIAGSIREINEAAAAIATAVEQQGAATRDIVGSVTLASSGTNEVTTNISGVARAAQATGAGAAQVLSASSELSEQAAALKSEVGTFLATVRAA